MNTKRITLIKSESDYDLVFERAFEIFDAKKGTSEFEELKRFGILIKNYENKHHSIETYKT